jgi:hypothetical protein
MSNSIEVHSDYASLSSFFQFEPVYRVPTYQRSYSWEQPEIEDFLRDLEKCYKQRKMTTGNEHHFFGQIVCISDTLLGTTDKKMLQIVDGQQRISTFIILAAAIVGNCDALLKTIEGDMNFNNEAGILRKRIEDLTKRFIWFPFEINGVIDEVNVLELSKHDKFYFTKLLRDPKNNTATLHSHERLKYAYGRIFDVTDKLTRAGQLIDHIGNLKTMEKVLLDDFFILKMVTSDTKAAFKLFQVLNNRGKNLTEGDLLRAETLRVLENFPDLQEIAERSWDEILTDHPTKTGHYLRAIYSSYTGKTVDTNTFFVELQKEFLPEHVLTVMDRVNAQRVVDRMERMKSDILLLRKLHEGEWCYPNKKPVEFWDRNRLYLLIKGLGHTECLPFLLSAQLLDHREFNLIVQTLEPFVFRFLTVGRMYIGDLDALYNEEAAYLRANAATYKASRLIAKLQPLQAQVTDETFRHHLDDLIYYRSGKSNKPVKYFLLTIEYFYLWYQAGATDTPTNNKEKTHDFNDISIEHIYPHAATGIVFDAALEPYKNQIGNLTLLGNEDNKAGDNDDFKAKLPIYQSSSLGINNSWLAGYSAWTLTELQQRMELLKDMACSIFKI